jgi:hypothetical protein
MEPSMIVDGDIKRDFHEAASCGFNGAVDDRRRRHDHVVEYGKLLLKLQWEPSMILDGDPSTCAAA